MRTMLFALLLVLLTLPVPSVRASDAQAALNGKAAGSSVPAYLSDEEKHWFKTFYEGNLLADGWYEITDYLLSRTPEAERAAQKRALDDLGRKIALEWARPNEVRKVDTDMLRDWGGLLKKTARQNPQQLAQVIAAIDQEVEAVLD